MPTAPSSRPVLPAALPLALMLSAGQVAWANDRPFQVARTAMMEDDENSWSFESWVQRFGRVRGLSVEPEYSFTDGRSVQLELSRSLDRDGGQTGQEAEVEFKQRFNNIARDGYGWGLSLALNTSRGPAEGRQHGWGLKLPLSIALGETGGLLHLNVGVDKASGDERRWVTAAVYERELFKRTHGFVELAREGDTRYGQVGVRHWLKKERLAVDLALQQHRSRVEGGTQRASGFILGLGWYDL